MNHKYINSICIVFTLIILIAYSSVQATTYYLADPTNGDAVTDWGGTPSDGNNGLSWATAFASFKYAESQMSKGDTLLFGTGRYYEANFEATAGKYSGSGTPMTVFACSSYVEADKDGGRYLASMFGGWKASGWTVHGDGTGDSAYVFVKDFAKSDYDTTTWNFDEASNGAVTRSSIWTLGLTGADTLLNPMHDIDGLRSGLDSLYARGPGCFYHDTANDSVFIWMPDSLDPDIDTVIISQRPAIFFRRDCDSLEFWGLDIQYGKNRVILWEDDGNTHWCEIDNCHVSKSAGIQSTNCSVIGSGIGDWTTDPPEYNSIIACSVGTVIQATWGNDGPGSPTTYNNAIEFYAMENIVVESCYVYGYCQNAIYFKNEWGTPQAPYTNNTAKFNTIVYPPNSVLEGQKAGIVWDEMPDRDSAYGNIIINANFGIWIHHGGGGSGYEATSPYQFRILNNTIINAEEMYFRIETPPDFVNGCGSDNVFKYNVCYGHQNSAYLESFAYVSFRRSPDAECQDNDCIIDSNAYYDDTYAFAGELYPGYSDVNFSTWQSTYGFDVNGVNVDFGLDTTSTYALPDTTSLTMNVTYGGRTWTVYGAVQTASEETTPTINITGTTLKGVTIK